MPGGQDAALAHVKTPIVICAMKASMMPPASPISRPAWYDAVNIKLDKTGGLTDALKLRDAAGRVA